MRPRCPPQLSRGERDPWTVFCRGRRSALGAYLGGADEPSSWRGEPASPLGCRAGCCWACEPRAVPAGWMDRDLEEASPFDRLPPLAGRQGRQAPLCNRNGIRRRRNTVPKIPDLSPDPLRRGDAEQGGDGRRVPGTGDTMNQIPLSGNGSRPCACPTRRGPGRPVKSKFRSEPFGGLVRFKG